MMAAVSVSVKLCRSSSAPALEELEDLDSRPWGGCGREAPVHSPPCPKGSPRCPQAPWRSAAPSIPGTASPRRARSRRRRCAPDLLHGLSSFSSGHGKRSREAAGAPVLKSLCLCLKDPGRPPGRRVDLSCPGAYRTASLPVLRRGSLSTWSSPCRRKVRSLVQSKNTTKQRRCRGKQENGPYVPEIGKNARARRGEWRSFLCAGEFDMIQDSLPAFFGRIFRYSGGRT